jgi:hypothetical protein
MELLASPVNELGRFFQKHQHYRTASAFYGAATLLAPEWAAPWFNRGLMAKFQRRWQDCLSHTLRATELDPEMSGAWWNLGIAATALGDWPVARRAWWRSGVSVPLGDGPPDMALGSVPIRLDPDGQAEVVWCERLDPARARIRSVPFPASGRGCGDLLLTDGEPRGYRQSGGRQVPVFNELQVLSPSPLSTFAVTLSAPNADAMAGLEDLAGKQGIFVEDWSTVRVLCACCSEGTPGPHEHDEAPDSWSVSRSVGVAAPHDDSVHSLLTSWAAAGPERSIIEVVCLLDRCSPASASAA